MDSKRAGAQVRCDNESFFIKEQEVNLYHTKITITDHAQLRMSQRNCSLLDIEYVLTHGTRHHAAGVTHFFLGRKDIPAQDKKVARFSKLEGTVVIADFSKDGDLIVITVYRNRDGLKDAHHKSKYDHKREQPRSWNFPLAG